MLQNNCASALWRGNDLMSEAAYAADVIGLLGLLLFVILRRISQNPKKYYFSVDKSSIPKFIVCIFNQKLNHWSFRSWYVCPGMPTLIEYWTPFHLIFLPYVLHVPCPTNWLSRHQLSRFGCMVLFEPRRFTGRPGSTAGLPRLNVWKSFFYRIVPHLLSRLNAAAFACIWYAL